MRVCLLSLAGMALIGWAPPMQAQSAWESGLMGLPDRPGFGTSVADLARFESNVRLAAPYLRGPYGISNYANNRILVSRMWNYLGGLDVLGRSPQYRGLLGPSIGRARALVLGYGLGYPYWTSGWSPLYWNQPGPGTAPAVPMDPPKPGPPPFSTKAPDLGEVSSAEQTQAKDLTLRYQALAARSAGIWESAEGVRINLVARGMALNTRLAEALLRLNQHLDGASSDLTRHSWESAEENLKLADHFSKEVGKQVGR